MLSGHSLQKDSSTTYKERISRELQELDRWEEGLRDLQRGKHLLVSPATNLCSLVSQFC